MRPLGNVLAFIALLIFPQFAPTPNISTIQDYGLVSEGSGWLLAGNRIFWTDDEGRNWREIAAFREEIVAADFVSPAAGWAVALARDAGEHGALQLAYTQDRGSTWRNDLLPLFATADSDPTVAAIELDFVDASHGSIRIQHVTSGNFERWSEWQTEDAGRTWNRLPSSGDEQAAATGTRVDPAVDAEYATVGYGWQGYREGRCDPAAESRDCHVKTGLRVTRDAGRTWTDLPLPPGVGGQEQWTLPQAAVLEAAAAVPRSRTVTVVGQGFDKCEIATRDQLLDWRANSPYSSVNLYIGGALRACSNRALTADYLRDLSGMGWTFIPTWVGPQSPCYQHSSRLFSMDPGLAKSQGVAEANAAADTLARLGLTEADGTGSIAYYDLEYYDTSNNECNLAVQAFVGGWVEQLHARGNLAGVYGTGSALRQTANLPQPPDSIWAANWIHKTYNSEATVWSVYGLSDGLWMYHQRLRQYTGGHDETWGNSTLNIDANVLDGVVAYIGTQPSATPTPTPTPTPTVTPVPFTPRAWMYLPSLLTP